MALIRTNLNENFREICQASFARITQNETHKMDAIDASIASSQTRKGASSQESLDDKNGRVQQVGALSGNCFPLHATRSKFILDSAERLRYVLLP
jgi:hypothetical protein